MPSSTPKQARTMRAAAHSPSFAKKIGIPQTVAREFVQADKGRFAEGGHMKESKAMMAKEVAFMKKKGAPKSMIKHEMAEAKGMKRGGYASGGLSSGHKAADGVARQGKTKAKQIVMRKGGAC